MMLKREHRLIGTSPKFSSCMGYHPIISDTDLHQVEVHLHQEEVNSAYIKDL